MKYFFYIIFFIIAFSLNGNSLPSNISIYQNKKDSVYLENISIDKSLKIILDSIVERIDSCSLYIDSSMLITVNCYEEEGVLIFYIRLEILPYYLRLNNYEFIGGLLINEIPIVFLTYEYPEKISKFIEIDTNESKLRIPTVSSLSIDDDFVRSWNFCGE